MLDQDWVYFKIDPTNMTFVNRIMEGYDHVGVVTALDGKQGFGFVRTTADTVPMAVEILRAMPFNVEIIPFDQINTRKH